MSEVCATCGAGFGSPADLVNHLKSEHQHDAPDASMEMNPEAHTPGLVCALCGRRFPSPQQLARHTLRPHGNRAARGRQPTPA